MNSSYQKNLLKTWIWIKIQGRIYGEGAGGASPPPEMTCGFSNTTGILQKKTMWFIGVEVEQETSAPPPKKILDRPMR